MAPQQSMTSALADFATETVENLKAKFNQQIPTSRQLNGLLGTSKESDLSFPSVVIEYTVPKNKKSAFRSWHRRMVKETQKAEGFLRVDRYRPLAVEDRFLKWYMVLHFDRPEHLDQWFQSTDREALLEAGQNIFQSYKFKSFDTGLEGWFSSQASEEFIGLGPPAWKEILVVVLGLYPIIMLQSFISRIPRGI
jgi:antibiotic biosynthesis monooxygenase (ABM) superfamily enzyme